MRSKIFDLNNPDLFWVDDGTRSIAYFCKNRPIFVDHRLIGDLKEVANSQGNNKNVRLCLHESPDDAFHEMIILERKQGYYRPHKHSSKGESYHIIEGRMAAFVFDEDGMVTESYLLDDNNPSIYRIDKNIFHSIMPLTEWVIYHEAKPGPFLGEGDSIFAKWAPDGTDESKCKEYSAELRKSIEPFEKE